MSPQSLETAQGSFLQLPATSYRSATRLIDRLAPWQIAAIFALLLYLPWLGERSLWFPDEPDVAEPAITMLQSGDWVVPRQNDAPWLDYPPLTYWLGAASSWIVDGQVADQKLTQSWSPFALRLPVALLAALLAGLTAWTTGRLAGKRAGIWAGLSLATAPHFAYQAVNYHPDMAFAVLISGGIALYAWGAVKLELRWSLASKIAGFACFGGAILAKGPLGLLLPGFILVLWHASARQWKSLLSLVPLSLAALAVALPWYGQLVRSLGWSEVWNELYLQNFARFGAGDRGHEQPWWYYLRNLWFNWAPWSLLLPAALTVAIRERWRDPAVRLALIWLFASLIFFSAATTKREVYLLPAYPAVAFLLGRFLDGTLEEVPRPQLRWFLRGVGGLSIATAAGLVIASVVLVIYGAPADALLLGELKIALACLCTVLGAGGIALLLSASRGISQRSLTAITLGLGLMYAVALGSILPSIDQSKSYVAVAESLRAAAGEEPFGYYPYGIETKRAGFRVEDPAYLPLRLLNTPREVANHLSGKSAVVILHPKRAQEIASSVAGWDDLPKREVKLGSRSFLVLGLGPREAQR